MDLLDILDIFVEPFTDLALCRGNFGIWFKKRFFSFLLTAGSFICLISLFSAIRDASVVGIVAWAIGTVLFAGLDIWYSVWWMEDGCDGADCPLIDKIPLPKGNLMNTPPEDAPFGTKPPENIWEKMGVGK